MATILNTNTGFQEILLAHHTFGRHHSNNNTIIENVDASRIHATILWDGECWYLKGKSTNGTYINGSRVQEESKNILKKNDTIHFGNLQSETWQLISTNAPESMLIPLTPELPSIVLEDVIVLPSEEDPRVLLSLSFEGQWVCESELGISILKSGDLVGTHDKIWRFIDTKPSINTQKIVGDTSNYFPEVDLYFNVSQNEEHVSLKIKVNQQTINLEERSHHYPLLLLARQRMEDNTKALNKSEQGWINKDVFSDMLGMKENHINIQIYRFRKQCIAALPKSVKLYQIIERRTGEIRLNCDMIQIEGGLQYF